jgi:CDP-diacylglycerol--glycerol-3-phosphate 3-phosphatidyltransferase
MEALLLHACLEAGKFGAMLDPIADKAMVVIALAVITALSSMNSWILLPLQ